MKKYTAAICIIMLTSCGGGGGGGGNEPIAANEYQAGVFRDSNDFFNRCENPTNGVNTATGQPYGPGSTLQENNWLRSWSDELYLWYDEIEDQNPAGFSTAAYFDELQTNATTASGNRKDRFHFTVPTPEWLDSSQSGIVSGYGFSLVLLSQTAPRDIRVAYTEPGTAATAAGIARGARILSVDGVDAVNANTQADVDVLNAGLFPTNNGETHSFEIQDVGSNITRTVDLQSAEITTTPVQNVSILPSAGANVGYLTFNDHSRPAEAQLANAITQLQAANIDDLVLDLRYNGGGFLFIASQLAYMIAGPAATNNRTFETLSFNDKHPDTDPVTGNTIEPVEFINRFGDTNQALPNLNLNRVYVLTGEDTCSASESIINGLDGIGIQVIQIGSGTCGKPYGFYATDNCATTYFTIQFRGVNDAGFGDFPDGFAPLNAPLGSVNLPGCQVADDFTRALGDPAEGLLAAALEYRISGACPAPGGSARAEARFSAEANQTPALALKDGKHPWRTNKILGR